MDRNIEGQELGAQVGVDAVMVRAHEDEPVMLRVVSRDKTKMVLTGSDAEHTIAFPLDHIYRFSMSLYEDLVAAYTRKDSDRLRSLWRNATHA